MSPTPIFSSEEVIQICRQRSNLFFMSKSMINIANKTADKKIQTRQICADFG